VTPPEFDPAPFIRRIFRSDLRTFGGIEIEIAIEIGFSCSLFFDFDLDLLPRHAVLLNCYDPAPRLSVRATRDGEVRELPEKFSRRLANGDKIRLETPGGGGYGREQS